MRRWINVALVVALCACSKKPAERSGKTVDVGGVGLFLDCRGEGSPTVLFESGLGLDGGVWDRAQTELARSSRACAYDRAGLGKSGPVPQPHAPDQMADELWALLNRAGQQPPYVLVGHSMGAAITRWFQRKHESAVIGMVLLDPVTEEWEARVLSTIPPERQGEFWSNVRRLEGLERTSLLASYSGLAGSGQALRGAPLVIMTAERNENDLATRREMHAKLTPLSGNSLHLLAPKSGHVIPAERPDLVVAAVQAVTRAARTNERLAPAQIAGSAEIAR
ncbi:MAG TPA: alpha/beta hydrolase [Polyangiaceae bacterium]|nr:alpha/beta hydrolase [Polyangiaceae bacterium]